MHVTSSVASSSEHRSEVSTVDVSLDSGEPEEDRDSLTQPSVWQNGSSGTGPEPKVEHGSTSNLSDSKADQTHLTVVPDSRLRLRTIHEVIANERIT